MLREDYYSLLGIDRGADQEEIRQAYRWLVRRCHPDLNPEVPEAGERLKRLNEAYEVLKDEGRRQRYDWMLTLSCAPWHSGSVRGYVPGVIAERRRTAIVPFLATLCAAAALLVWSLDYLSPSRPSAAPVNWPIVSQQPQPMADSVPGPAGNAWSSQGTAGQPFYCSDFISSPTIRSSSPESRPGRSSDWDFGKS